MICVRDPAEVADSLHRRDGIASADAVRQWAVYLSSALVNTSGLPRMIVPFDSYFRRPVETAARLARFAGRDGAFDGPAGERRLAGVVDDALWRSRAGANGERAGAGEAASLFRIAELLAASEEGREPARAAKLQAAAEVHAAESSTGSPSPPRPQPHERHRRRRHRRRRGRCRRARGRDPRRLGPPPERAEWPLVSIVVPNRDGAPMLQRLLRGLRERTDYPRLELILVDNCSSDGSVELTRRLAGPVPLVTVAAIGATRASPTAAH